MRGPAETIRGPAVWADTTRPYPVGQEGVQAKTHSKNDPSTPQAWLPNRTEPFSISHPSMNAAMSHDFRPCVGLSETDHYPKPPLIDAVKALAYTCFLLAG